MGILGCLGGRGIVVRVNARSFMLAVTGVVSLVLAGLATSSPAGAAQQPLQAVIHGAGCGDPIKISALDRKGKVTSERVLVQGKPGFQLSAKAVSTDDTQFMFTSYDCNNKNHTLYRQYFGRRPVAQPLMALPLGWWMEGVTWDIARGTPAVLIRDPNFNYQLQALLPAGWTTLWSGDRASFGGKSPDDLESRSGYEYLIVGDDLGDSWSMWRLSTSGTFSGFLSEMLAGPGEINGIADGFSDRVNVYVGPDGTWICDWSASGTIQEALTQGKCATVPGGAAYYGVTILGEGSKEWLVLSHLLGPSSQTQFECVGQNFLSCGSPVIGKRENAQLNGNDFAYMYIGESKRFLKKPFNRLGSSRI